MTIWHLVGVLLVIVVYLLLALEDWLAERRLYREWQRMYGDHYDK